MPKRKIKEEKPKKRLSKKEVLIAPIIMGAATVAALLVSQIAPPPDPTTLCLKNHNVEQFQLHPHVELMVDGQSVMLPDNVGRQPKDGQECIRPIHTDETGNIVHIEYIRPIRFTMADFMKIYEAGGNSITVVNNSTGTNVNQTLNLDNYDVKYSYYSENNEFTPVPTAADVPPFRENMVVRAELTHK